MNPNFAPENIHLPALIDAPRRRAYPGGDYAEWRRGASARLTELLGWSPPKCDLDIRIESDRVESGIRYRRIVFTAEPGADVPAILATPVDAPKPPPLMLCIQGHTDGMSTSMGQYEGDFGKRNVVEFEMDFAVQALRQGFAALAYEQRCFGERTDQRGPDQKTFPLGCHHASMNALILGRTMIGERVYDMRRAIDMVEQLGTDSGADLTRIGAVGSSGGGTTILFGGALEPRIQATLNITYLCTLKGCIGSIDHCTCNYIPGFANEFDLPDIAGLFAPKPMVVVAGDEDNIFPLAEVAEAFNQAKALYTAAGAEGAIELHVGHGGHRQFAAETWPIFRRLTGW